MEYTKVICKLEPDNQINRELLEAELGTIGFESFQDAEDWVEAYIPSKDYSDELMNSESLNNHPLFSLTFETEIIPDQNWNAEWEENEFEPIIIADKVVIRSPSHNNFPDVEHQIIIDPNQSFGTGDHETTSMIVRMIMQQELAGKNILDMGCGTGILGIFAAMCGAPNVTAIDIDEWSFESTETNAILNRVMDKVHAKLGDASLLGNEKFDVIYANIHRNVLLNDMEAYTSVMNPECEIIFSGFYQDDMVVIKQKAESLGLTEVDFLETNNWIAYRFKK